MGLFKLRKNKRYDYQPRYYEKDGEGRPFEIKHKFDEYRNTIGPSGNIKTRFNRAMGELDNPDRAANRRIFYIVAALILIFLFLIDFDLSIFFQKS